MNEFKSISKLAVPRVPSKSPYSKKQKIKMATWWAVEKLIFSPSPHVLNRLRCSLLRLFGAKIGENTFIHSKAKIWFPWNFSIGSNSGVGFDALIYSLDKISVGDYSTVSQRCHLNTGSHDYRDPKFSLVTSPIVIEDGAFIGADTYIGMGVKIGRMAVIGARSVVVSDQPAYNVCVGHPCKPIKSFEIDVT